MSPPREASPEMIHDVLEATNRRTATEYHLTEADLEEQFGPESRRILGAVEELTPLLPNEFDGTMEIKWGHDDEGNFGSLPPNEGDGPDSNDPTIFEKVPFKYWDIYRTENALYIAPHGNSGGPVVIWFTPKQG